MPDVCVREVLNRDVVTARWIVAQVSRDRVGNRELPLLFEHHDRRCGELLGHGADLEHHVRGKRDPEFNVGHPGGADEDDFVADGNDRRRTRLVGGVGGIEHALVFVHLGWNARWLHRRDREQRGRGEERTHAVFSGLGTLARSRWIGRNKRRIVWRGGVRMVVERVQTFQPTRNQRQGLCCGL